MVVVPDDQTILPVRRLSGDHTIHRPRFARVTPVVMVTMTPFGDVRVPVPVVSVSNPATESHTLLEAQTQVAPEPTVLLDPRANVAVPMPPKPGATKPAVKVTSEEDAMNT